MLLILPMNSEPRSFIRAPFASLTLDTKTPDPTSGWDIDSLCGYPKGLVL